MLQQQVSPLQLYKSPTLPAGLTKSSHLSRAFLTQPKVFGEVFQLGVGYQTKSILQMLTGGLGNTEVTDNGEFRWWLKSQHTRAIFVKGNISAGSTPGIDNSDFYVILEEKAFGNGDILNSDSGTAVIVKGEAYSDEGGYVYCLQLTTSDRAAFIDPNDVAAGARFNKDFSAYPELSERGNSNAQNAPFPLRNRTTIMRKTREVSRSAATDFLIMKFSNPMNPSQTTTTWTRYAEWQDMQDWIKERDALMMYGIYNATTIKGVNGDITQMGAGLRQQIAPTNVFSTNKVTFDFLDGIFHQLSYNSSQYGGNQKFTVLTGRMGMREASNAISEKLRILGYAFIPREGQFISGEGNELTFTGDQFTTAKFPNNITVTFVHFPPYDDKERNRLKDPISGEPLESYRMTIINTGGTDGKSNIRRVIKKDSENIMFHIPGTMDPTATHKSLSTPSASGIDGYRYDMLTEEGLILENPLSCAEILRAVV